MKREKKLRDARTVWFNTTGGVGARLLPQRSSKDKVRPGGLPLEIFRRRKFSAYSRHIPSRRRHDASRVACIAAVHRERAVQRRRQCTVNYRESVFNSLPKLAVNGNVEFQLLRSACYPAARAFTASKNVCSPMSIALPTAMTAGNYFNLYLN